MTPTPPPPLFWPEIDLTLAELFATLPPVRLPGRRCTCGRPWDCQCAQINADCPTCSTENAPMSIPGRSVHYRCAGCGMGYSETLTEAAWEAYGASWGDAELS